MEIQGVRIIIREVHRVDLPWGRHYIASCQIVDGDYVSHVFQVPFRDAEELRKNLERDILLYLRTKRVLGDRVAKKVL